MKAEAIVALLRHKGWRLATAESCTGGMVAAAITDISGSSNVFDRGFVTYSNSAKSEMLDVPHEVIQQHGAVSETVAALMAKGALLRSKADVAIAITGIAGPGGGTILKPVGLVHFACAWGNSLEQREMRFEKMNRAEIRSASVAVALELVARACGHN